MEAEEQDGWEQPAGAWREAQGEEAWPEEEPWPEEVRDCEEVKEGGPGGAGVAHGPRGQRWKRGGSRSVGVPHSPSLSRLRRG